MENRKHNNDWCIVGIVFGIMIVIFGVIVAITNLGIDGYYVSSERFGGDFYTEIHSAAGTIASNERRILDLLSILGGCMFGIIGSGFIIHYARAFCPKDPSECAASNMDDSSIEQ